MECGFGVALRFGGVLTVFHIYLCSKTHEVIMWQTGFVVNDLVTLSVSCVSKLALVTSRGSKSHEY